MDKIKIIIFSLSLLLLINCKDSTTKTSNKKIEVNKYNYLEKEIKLQYIYDFENLFSKKDKIVLKEKMINYFKNTNTIFIIITIDYMGKYDDVYKYATNIRNIFNENLNNNKVTLILISNKNRKLAISSNIENNVSSDFYNSVMDSIIIPKIKNKEYYNGFNLALDTIMVKYNITIKKTVTLNLYRQN